jgi:hypothetical protein
MDELLKSLEELEEILKKRHREHGFYTDIFDSICVYWSDFLGVEITPEKVSIMMILLKIARLKTASTKKDSLLDIAGYSLLAKSMLKE